MAVVIPEVPFTKEMKKDYTILLPNMLPTHFKMIQEIFVNFGYHAELLFNEGPNVIAEGLKYVHNDMCYPAQLVIGQMLDAIHSGNYDKHKIALIITQTGGGCRASNYIYLLRKALKKAHMGYIPVLSLSVGMEKHPGFKPTLRLLLQSFAAILFGDLITLLANQTRPYEVNKGETEKIIDALVHDFATQFSKNSGYIGWNRQKNIVKIARAFEAIPIHKTEKVRVGVVGEIYIKFAPLGNNHLQDFLESEGCEVMIPGLLGYFLYSMENARYDKEYYGGLKAKLKWPLRATSIHYLSRVEKGLYNTVAKITDKFTLPEGFDVEKKLSEGIIDHGVKMGEGWLLSAEMVELYDLGYPNIVQAQPFGCLPNHIVAKGVVRSITAEHSDINIVPIDYDPSTSRVNQENRIKLMLSVAREKLEKSEESEDTQFSTISSDTSMDSLAASSSLKI